MSPEDLRPVPSPTTSPSDPPEVLVVVPSAVRGSSAMCTLAFLRWSNEHLDHPPRALVLAGGQLKHEFRQAGAKVIESPRSLLRVVERSLLRAGRVRTARRVRKVLHTILFARSPRPRTVLAITVSGAGPVLRHLRSGTELIIYTYETGQVLDDLIDRDMMNRLIRATRWWVAATDEIATDLVERGVAVERIVTLAPFIDGPTVDRARARELRRDVPAGSDKVIVGGIGRSDWRDGPDLFLRAATILHRRHPDLPVHFVWVGAPDDGPARWILEHDIRHAGLEGMVTLTGVEEDTEEWLSLFDILCLTSREDPPPPSVLQAGALGVPVVAYGLPSMRELHDSVGGPPAIHITRYLDAEAMADALNELVRDPISRQRGGEDLQKLVIGFRLTHDGAPELWDIVERTLDHRTAS